MANRLLVLLLITSVLIGCASVGRKIEQSEIDKIKIGETTRQQILDSIGSPDQMTRHGNGDTMFIYTYARATTKPESFIPIAGSFVGGMNVQNQSVIITFGSNGIVQDIVSSQGTTETGMGLSAGSKASLDEVEQDKRPK